MTVWKFPLAIVDQQTIKIPANAAAFKPLFVGIQNGKLCFWAEVDDELKTMEEITIYVCGTGNPIPSPRQYLGSAVIGTFVWHVYRGRP